jgi:hypothetical protein
MKESELRSMIRKQIKESLKENDSFLKQVGGSVRSKLGSRRQMLDRILSTIDTERLTKLPRVQKIDLLVALVQKFGISEQDFASIKSRVQRNLGLGESIEEAEGTKLSGSLASRGEKLEKTQAFKMLMKAVEAKPTAQQVDFAIDFLSKLPLDDAGKRRLKMKIRQFL